MGANLIALTCVVLQISLELTIRATLVHSFGLKSILKNNLAKLPESKIKVLYIKNALKVTEFNRQKNYMKLQQ